MCNPTEPGNRVVLAPGTRVRIDLCITDVGLFCRNVLKEHAPLVQGPLAFGKCPTAGNVANAVYDEVCGWLDAPSAIGITVVNVCVDKKSAYTDSVIGLRATSTNYTGQQAKNDPRPIQFSDVVALMSDLQRLDTDDSDLETRIRSLQERARILLANTGKAAPNAQQTEASNHASHLGNRGCKG